MSDLTSDRNLLQWGKTPNLSLQRESPNAGKSPWVIKVALTSTDATRHDCTLEKYGQNISSCLTPEQIAAFMRVKAEYENAGNLVIKVVAPSEKADIRLFQAAPLPPNGDRAMLAIPAGNTKTEKNGLHKDLLINPSYRTSKDFSETSYGYMAMLHDFGHLLGLAHPGATGRGGEEGGANKNYTTDTTIMSYNWGQIREFHLRDYDKAAIASMFGPPLKRMQQTAVEAPNVGPGLKSPALGINPQNDPAPSRR